MANNRLWAVCKDDSEATALCKYYPGPGGWGGFRENPEFFDEHENCPSNKGCNEHMMFVTELDDRVEQYDFRDYTNPKIYLK